MFIYRITNTVNGKFYVGKTTKTLEERLQRHFYSAKYGSQTYLHRAIRKHGHDKFIVEQLESNVNDLDEAEERYIAELNPHYNMTTGGEGGDTSDSPNFKRSMKEYHKNKPKSEYATYGMLGKTSHNKGKRVIDSKCKQVSCDGIIFDSIQIAQDHFPGISIRKRLASDKYPKFYRLIKKCRVAPIALRSRH